MRASPMVRAARALVFAALCVLLSALAHQTMSGHPVPLPTLAAAGTVTGLGAWAFARRERGPGAVIVGALVTQGLLHTAFTLAGPHGAPRMAMSAREWADLLLCGSPNNGSLSQGEAVELLNHAGLGHLGAAPSHGGGDPTGMLAAHVLVALLSAVWLWGGERAVFRLLRATTRRLLAPVRWLLSPRPLVAPAAWSTLSAVSDHAPRQLLLVRVVPSRGPPAAPAVA
ncbi:hypothetical protein [Streptomyces litchfieldiae]|uniref:Integral membrane protein n=1 Tax=Streptomyces litchfieldiae TaxID=3075543 RepID=A0ABU2MXR7_9ACTN|nr:hypothetical protein [Streptomyces sp. DSM 44938]MDT0346436.1 hypothetical protein [Streptomyces sp. DSM 44938]